MANHSENYSLPEYPRYYLVENAEVHIIASGGSQDRVILGLYPDHAVVVFEGDASPVPLSHLIKELASAGHLPAIKSVLFDFRQFTGMIDWDFAKDKDKNAWGQTWPEKFAYVMRDKTAAVIAKGLALYVYKTECRVFLSHAEALCWLGWDEPESGHCDFAIAASA